MKSTNPKKLLIALMVAGSLCTLPAYAAGVGASTGAGVNTGAGSVGVGTSTGVNGAGTGVNGAGTTGTGATGSGTINDPTLMPNPTETTPERMDRTVNKRPNATPTNPSGNRGTNMRNKDCDVNVSSNDPTRNCDDTSKPKK